MHQVLLWSPNNKVIDHINGNGLDNRLSNLRIVDHQDNIIHRTKLNKNNTSGFRGIFWSGKRKLWVVTLRSNYKTYNIGGFDSLEEAKRARSNAEKKYFGSVQQQQYDNQ